MARHEISLNILKYLILFVFKSQLMQFNEENKTVVITDSVEASNVINDPKCNKGPKRNNFWP